MTVPNAPNVPSLYERLFSKDSPFYYPPVLPIQHVGILHRYPDYQVYPLLFILTFHLVFSG